MNRLTQTYIQEHLMGPNAIRMLDELLKHCSMYIPSRIQTLGDKGNEVRKGSGSDKRNEPDGRDRSVAQTDPVQDNDLRVRQCDSLKICDLGCGTGLTSMALADRFPNAHIWGCDLWVSEEENRSRFAEMGFGN